jgi:hypothetical protein
MKVCYNKHGRFFKHNVSETVFYSAITLVQWSRLVLSKGPAQLNRNISSLTDDENSSTCLNVQFEKKKTDKRSTTVKITFMFAVPSGFPIDISYVFLMLFFKSAARDATVSSALR